MGKASRWFRAVLGLKKSDASPSQPPKQPHSQREKRRWSFVKSYREKETPSPTTTTAAVNDLDPEKHAIAVAAATAAVAEAAVAAAQAAAAVVRLTSSGRCIPAAAATELEELAAVKIQSAFRGYLARRALRALKGLVKIQALVRGHIARKQQTEKMRRMQAMFRVQARARVERSQLSESSQSSSKSSHFQHPIQDPATPEKFEQYVRVKTTSRDHSPLHRKTVSRSIGKSIVYQDRPRNISFSEDKILEVDTMKQRFRRTQGSNIHEPCSGEVQSLSPLKLFPHEVEDSQFCTAHNSPQLLSASSQGGSSRRSPFTPTKSDGSRSFLSGYSDHPNYMAFTESSKAKARSFSAPRQRPQFDKSSSIKRFSIHGYGESRHKVASSLQAVTFASRAYPGSGRLDRLGMPQGRGEGLGYGY